MASQGKGNGSQMQGSIFDSAQYGILYRRMASEAPVLSQVGPECIIEPDETSLRHAGCYLEMCHPSKQDGIAGCIAHLATCLEGLCGSTLLTASIHKLPSACQEQVLSWANGVWAAACSGPSGVAVCARLNHLGVLCGASSPAEHCSLCGALSRKSCRMIVHGELNLQHVDTLPVLIS